MTSLPSRACPLYQKLAFLFSFFYSIAIAHLGEKGCPDGLNLLDLCGLDQGLELVGLGELAHCAHSHVPGGKSYSDVDTVIGEDEGCVGGGELGDRHCDGLRGRWSFG